MRTIIHFAVTGTDRGDLMDKAEQTYRQVMGDPEAKIPYSATIEVSPETVVEGQDGTKVAQTWTGEVTVQLAADGASQ